MTNQPNANMVALCITWCAGEAHSQQHISPRDHRDTHHRKRYNLQNANVDIMIPMFGNLVNTYQYSLTIGSINIVP